MMEPFFAQASLRKVAKTFSMAPNRLIMAAFLSLLFFSTSCSLNYVSYGSGRAPSKEARKKLYKVNQRKVNASIWGSLDAGTECADVYYVKKRKPPRDMRTRSQFERRKR